jgi:hypothetical protein
MGYIGPIKRVIIAEDMDELPEAPAAPEPAAAAFPSAARDTQEAQAVPA